MILAIDSGILDIFDGVVTEFKTVPDAVGIQLIFEPFAKVIIAFVVINIMIFFDVLVGIIANYSFMDTIAFDFDFEHNPAVVVSIQPAPLNKIPIDYVVVNDAFKADRWNNIAIMKESV
jgi:hypothetical protein